MAKNLTWGAALVAALLYGLGFFGQGDLTITNGVIEALKSLT